MVEIIDLYEQTFNQEPQMHRLKNFAVTNLAYCCRKYFYDRYFMRIGIDGRTYSKQTKDNLETGRLIGQFYQTTVYPELAKKGIKEYGLYPSPDLDKWVEVEVTGELEGERVVGHIDQILLDEEGKKFIQDLKVSKAFKYYNSLENISLGYKIQLNLYDYLTENTYDYLRLMVINYNKVLQFKIFDIPKEDFLPLIRERIRRIKKAEEEMKAPKPVILESWECNPKYCPYTEICEYASEEKKNREGVKVL